MDKERFIKSLTIDNEGFYPFQLVANKKDGTSEMCALAVNRVQHVYNAAKNYIFESDSIFFAADFPADKRMEMETDYIGIYSFENGKWSCDILPYKNEVFLPIIQNKASSILLGQFLQYIS